MSNFALLETKKGRENKVITPASCDAARGPHTYDRSVGHDGMVVGYVPVSFEHQEYPKMLFHPKYGAKPEPTAGKFTVGCVTADQYQQALVTFQEALAAWQRENRTKVATSEAEEARLVKKGWLASPPVRKLTAAMDPNSDEI
jgi:hypothetical protein